MKHCQSNLLIKVRLLNIIPLPIPNEAMQKTTTHQVLHRQVKLKTMKQFFQEPMSICTLKLRFHTHFTSSIHNQRAETQFLTNPIWLLKFQVTLTFSQSKLLNPLSKTKDPLRKNKKKSICFLAGLDNLSESLWPWTSSKDPRDSSKKSSCGLKVSNIRLLLESFTLKPQF